VKIAAQAQFDKELKPLLSEMEPDKLNLLALVQAKRADLVLAHVHKMYPGKEPWLQGQCRQVISDGFNLRIKKGDTAEEFLKMILPGSSTTATRGETGISASAGRGGTSAGRGGTSASQSTSGGDDIKSKPSAPPGGNTAGSSTYAHPELGNFPQLPLIKTRGPPELIPMTDSNGKKNAKRSTDFGSDPDSDEDQPIIKKPPRMPRMIPVDAIREFIRTTLEGEEGVTMKQMKTLVSDNFLIVDLIEDGDKIKMWTGEISKKMQEEWAEEI
jgi:hypothetical protein